MTGTGPVDGDPLNPYTAPRAELDAPQPALMPANLENAVEGRHAFTIGPAPVVPDAPAAPAVPT